VQAKPVENKPLVEETKEAVVVEEIVNDGDSDVDEEYDENDYAIDY
jgi:hypothetical protein